MGCCENVIIYIFIPYKQNRICGGEENLATLDSGSNTQRHYDENIENK